MKKILSLILAAMMCLTMVSTVFAAEFKFTDVKESDWFYNDVKGAVEMGLINGKSETEYKPNDNLTYAEAIKLAACMNQLYNDGAVTLKNGTPWYQTYVDYCVEKGIIDKEYNYTDMVTRAGYMVIFAKALPDDGLKAINNIPDDSIPDVPSSKNYAEGVYKLYRAGILQGVDGYHNCNPLANIKRSEVAAILTRMMDESARIKFSTITEAGGGSGSGGSGGTTPVKKPLEIIGQPADCAVKVGETATVFVEAEGGKDPYTYQWQVEVVTPGGVSAWYDIQETNSLFEDETTDTLCAQMDSDGSKSVRCVITDDEGEKVTSDVAVIEFKADKMPLSAKISADAFSATVGESVTFGVTAEGGKAPYTYQWQMQTTAGWYDLVDNPFFSGAVSPELDVALTEKAVEKFRCVVKDADGEEAISDIITLTVNELAVLPLTIKTQPVDVTDAALYDYVSFTFSVSGGKAPIKYQWQQKLTSADDFKNLTAESKGTMANEGFDTDTLTVKVTNVGSGRYEYRCIVTDANGDTVTSDAVSYKIADTTAPFAIVTQPENTKIIVGKTGTLSVKAEGGKAPYTYQWQQARGKEYVDLANNVLVSGTDKPVLSVTPNDALIGETITVRCVITDANGEKLTTDTAKVIVEEAVLTLAKVKFDVQGLNTSSQGVIVWGVLETGVIKQGDKLYLNDAGGFYMAEINIVKLEFDRKLVTSVNAADAGTKTVGILTDLDASKWKNIEVDDCTIDTDRGTVVTQLGGGSDENYFSGTVVTTPVTEPLKITAQPQNVTILKEAERANAYFEVEVEGGKAPYKYQWYLGNMNSASGKFEFAPIKENGSDMNEYIMGTTTDTLVISTTKIRAYIVYCIITDAEGNTVQTDTVSLSRP